MQDQKSQLQNCEQAMQVLRSRLYEQELAAKKAEQAENRRTRLARGERSDKIRTYNYPQGRVTDHRVKLTSRQRGSARSAGELDEFTASLEAEEKRLKLEDASLAIEGVIASRRPRCVRSTPSAPSGCDTPDLDAEVLISDAMGVERGSLVADPRPGDRARRGAADRRAHPAPDPSASRLHTSSAARGSGSWSWRSTGGC